MLTCALIVWILQPVDWNKKLVRETFLTETECKKNLDISTHYCIKIDKRNYFTNKEWELDNCSLSEHIWSGVD